MAFLEIKNLTKSFGGKKVLAGINIALEEGATLCLIGNSGSGKTTLLRILDFLEKKDEGLITLDGRVLSGNEKLTGLEIAERRKNFGLVFQSYNLFPLYTVLENILLPLKIQLKKEIKEHAKTRPWRERRKAFQKEYAVKLREKEAEIDGILSKMNLLAKKGSYPYSLSGGEAQRTAIVRALALHPKILCFDEPTSALDPRLKNEIAETILALKKGGTTMIVVTHEMAFALKVADAVIYMEDGKAIESGDASILLHPKTQELKDFLSGEAE